MYQEELLFNVPHKERLASTKKLSLLSHLLQDSFSTETLRIEGK